MHRTLAILFAVGLPAQGFVSPSHFASVEGTGNSTLPFGWATPPVRFLQVHDGVPAMTVQGLAFRYDAAQSTSMNPQPWLRDLRIAAHAAACSDRPGASRRSDAARLLTRQLRSEPVPADLLLAVCWPTNPVLDPVHTWLGVLAAERVTAAERAALLPQLERLLAARHVDTAGELAASWEPAGELSRAATTAWHMRSLGHANTLWRTDRRAAGPTLAASGR